MVSEEIETALEPADDGLVGVLLQPQRAGDRRDRRADLRNTVILQPELADQRVASRQAPGPAQPWRRQAVREPHPVIFVAHPPGSARFERRRHRSFWSRGNYFRAPFYACEDYRCDFRPGLSAKPTPYANFAALRAKRPLRLRAARPIAGETPYPGAFWIGSSLADRTKMSYMSGGKDRSRVPAQDHQTRPHARGCRPL